MNSQNRDIILSPKEQHKIRKLLGEVKTISEYLGDAAELLKGGKGWLAEAAPWLADVGEEVPILKVAVKLGEKWLAETHPFELGAVACTLAWQQAAAQAIEKHWTSALSYNEAKQLDDRVVERIRSLPPAEAADLSTFTRKTALQHPFVQRADAILDELLGGIGADEALRTRIFNDAHTGFLRNLDLLLSDKKTAEKFAPFKDWMELDGGRQAAFAALQIHAKYQRDQYESEPLFRREPYALKHIYVNTECGKLLWGEIRGERGGQRGKDFDEQTARRDPFSENHGGRHDLLETVMGYITDRKFNEPIVIQGVAGAGKSSFTLRLCAELWEKGFHPIRIRLKRLRLSDPSSLIDAMNRAIELADEDRLAGLPIEPPDDLLQKGDIFRTPYGSDAGLCRYVVILDGWDELELTGSDSFREKVGEMLREVRRYFLDSQRRCKVRVIVTGRPSPDVVESRFLNDDTPVLTMRPIRPAQLSKFVDDLNDAVGMTPPYVAVEEWEEWRVPHSYTLGEAFKKYEEAFDCSLPKYDEQGKIEERDQAPDSASLEVLGLPLLAYLTIRVMAEVVAHGGPLEEQQKAINEMIENPTLLYRRLTDLTCLKAGKAQLDERDGADEIERQAREIGDKLRQRLQQTAAAMSVLGAEHISRDEWIKRVPQEKDQRAEQRTRSAEDHPLSRLMISFYFKGGQPEQGCEFAHKSFREYLFAECVVETIKAFGRGLTGKEVERWPKRNFWREYSPEEDRDRRDFSRNLSHLLAPQWIMPNVCGHLRGLLEWEIDRSFAGASDAARQSRLAGLPTQPLTREEWQIVRDVSANLWAWWSDGAHLRPQIKTDRFRGADVRPPFVEELIRGAAPRVAELDETLQLESSTSLDAHLGEGLFQLCAWVHFFVAQADGWLAPRGEAGEAPAPDQLWKGVTARKVFNRGKGEVVVGKEDAPHPFQATIVQGAKEWRVFAPSGADLGLFQRCIARVNAAEGRPAGSFPRQGEGQGIDLRGARLVRASLDGARLDGARLDGARLEQDEPEDSVDSANQSEQSST